MQNLIEASNDIMARFIAAAKAKEAQFGDWLQDTKPEDPELALSEKVVREAQLAKTEEEYERLEQLLDDSLTPAQRTLKQRMEHAEAEMEIMGEEAYKTAENAFYGSYTPEQKALIAQQRKLIDKMDELDHDPISNDALLQSAGLSIARHALTCAIPEDFDERHTSGVTEVIDTTLNLALFGRVRTPPAEIEYANILLRDGRFIFRISGDPPLDLKKIQKMLREDIPPLLGDASRWRRVNTPRGTGYCLEIKYDLKDGFAYRNNAVFNVVIAFAGALSGSASHYPKDMAYSLNVDGVEMSKNEYNAMQKRERAASDSPEETQASWSAHNITERITLTGQAATDILGALGVNKDLIPAGTGRAR